MLKQIYFSSILTLLLVFLACVSFLPPESPEPGLVDITRENHLSPGFNKSIDFYNLREGDLKAATAMVLREADTILAEILSIPDSVRTFENTLLRLDDLYNAVSLVWNPAGLLGAVHPSEVIRNEADESEITIQQYFIDLSINEKLYQAVSAYSTTDAAATLSGGRLRFLESELRDFKRSGLGLDKKKREKLKEIRNSLSLLSIDFENNIAAYSDTILITEETTDGLPDDYKKEHILQDGRYAIDLSYPSFYPFMEYAESDSLRKVIRTKFLNRGMPENLKILEEIISKRRQMAKMLGYSSYAEYAIEESMAKTPAAVWDFENGLRERVDGKADRDTQEMLNIKQKLTDSTAAMVYDWEKYYYENQLLLRKYKVNAEEVKQYFEVKSVINGLFTLSQLLFGIKYSEVEYPSLWHEDVKMYEVREESNGKLLGRFYLDLYPRPFKYQHAAEFNIVSGKKIGDSYQLPVACLVCNFPRPTENNPALFTHEDVETFFHEFGHLLHDMLTNAELSSQAGTSVAMDFVEAPSQMLENWMWNKQALNQFARHYKTGELIPDTLLQRMLAARNLQSGNDLLQQILYGTLDMTFYDRFDPSGKLTMTETAAELQNSITHYPYIEGTHQLASFGHLLGYGAAYYGYLWSEVYAADMFSVFEKEGVLNPAIGYRFRKSILEKGGSEDPMEMVRAFLGREPNNGAFLKNQGIAE